jgi:hypothetical protein
MLNVEVFPVFWQTLYVFFKVNTNPKGSGNCMQRLLKCWETVKVLHSLFPKAKATHELQQTSTSIALKHGPLQRKEKKKKKKPGKQQRCLGILVLDL